MLIYNELSVSHLCQLPASDNLVLFITANYPKCCKISLFESLFRLLSTYFKYGIVFRLDICEDNCALTIFKLKECEYANLLRN